MYRQQEDIYALAGRQAGTHNTHCIVTHSHTYAHTLSLSHTNRAARQSNLSGWWVTNERLRGEAITAASSHHCHTFLLTRTHINTPGTGQDVQSSTFNFQNIPVHPLSEGENPHTRIQRTEPYPLQLFSMDVLVQPLSS